MRRRLSLLLTRISFITRSCLFGLKDMVETHQRIVNKVFKEHIKRKIEVYVDDILAKSQAANHYIADLEKTFAMLR